MNWTEVKDRVLGRWCEGRETAGAVVYLRYCLTAVAEMASQNLALGGLTRCVIGKGLDLWACFHVSI